MTRDFRQTKTRSCFCQKSLLARRVHQRLYGKVIFYDAAPGENESREETLPIEISRAESLTDEQEKKP